MSKKYEQLRNLDDLVDLEQVRAALRSQGIPEIDFEVTEEEGSIIISCTPEQLASYISSWQALTIGIRSDANERWKKRWEEFLEETGLGQFKVGVVREILLKIISEEMGGIEIVSYEKFKKEYEVISEVFEQYNKGENKYEELMERLEPLKYRLRVGDGSLPSFRKFLESKYPPYLLKSSQVQERIEDELSHEAKHYNFAERAAEGTSLEGEEPSVYINLTWQEEEAFPVYVPSAGHSAQQLRLLTEAEFSRYREIAFEEPEELSELDEQGLNTRKGS
jgi:hypothetical protein